MDCMKVNCCYYCDVLLSQHICFQQDSAPAHRTLDAIQLLQPETPDFIGPDLWPPNSPDLNPADYNIRGVVPQRVHKCRVSNVDELKQHLVEVWDDRQQTVIDSAVSQWRQQLRTFVHRDDILSTVYKPV